MTPLSPPSFLQPSPFEQAFLGGPVFWLTEPEKAKEASTFGTRENASLIACRTNNDLSRYGFRRIETLVTFEMPMAEVPDLKLPKDTEIRRAGPKDSLACQAIATKVLRYNRFHTDPAIDDNVADALRASWIENDIRGRADRVLVACREREVLGFNALIQRDEMTVIDLIAVTARAQGKGIGKALVAAAKTSTHDGVLRAGTQVNNAKSLAFYKSLGFHEIDRTDTWHWT